MTLRLLVIILLTIGGCFCVIDLHFIGLYSLTGSYTGESKRASVALALKDIHVNGECIHLPGYRLVVYHDDGKCERGPGIDAMYKHLYQDPPKLMIIGPSCSNVCQPVAEAALLWNLTVISYSATSPSLSDKTKYPRFFRTVAPDSCVIPARIAMMAEFGWAKIATIHETFEIFTEVSDAVHEEVTARNWTILTSEIMTSDVSKQVTNLKREDARIIFAGFYVDNGLRLMCEAFKQGLYGENYVWFFMNWVDSDWIDRAENITTCTRSQLLETIQYSFFTGPLFVNPKKVRGIAGLTTDEFDKMYMDHFDGIMPFGSAYRMPAYDSVWAVALALNITLTKLIEMGSPKRLEDFTYSDIEMANLMTESMKEVEFEGLEGHVKFDESGGVSPNVIIEQQQGEKRVNVGRHNPETNRIEWKNGGPKWMGGKPPPDSSHIVTTQIYVSDTLYACLCAWAIVGMLQCLGFFIFNVLFRAKRVIKMSSPNINNLVLLGCVICYSTIFFADVKQAKLGPRSTCVIRLCTFVIGFSTAFGALFSKTWRVHTILTTSTKNLKRTKIQDSHLLMMVIALVTVDSLVITIWQTVDPYYVNQKNLTAIENSDSDIIVVPQINTCSSKFGIYFTGTLYVVQGLVMAFGAFLSWETRKVQVDALNDSKLIAMCIYNVLLLSCLGAAINFVLDSDVDSSYGFVNGIILTGTMITSTIVFVPKILSVRRGDAAVGNILTTKQDNPTVQTHNTYSVSAPESSSGLRPKMTSHSTQVTLCNCGVEA